VSLAHSVRLPALRTAAGAGIVGGGVFAAALVGIAASAKPTLSLLVAVGVTYLVAAYRNLTVGLVVFTFLVFFANAASKLGAGVTVTKLGGILLAALWFLVIFSRGNRKPLLFRDLRVFSTLVFAFIAWEMASITWAHDGSTALSNAGRLLQGLILIFVIYTAISEPRHVRWLMSAFVIGVFIVTVVALVSGPGSAKNGGRISGGYDDPNEFAGVVVPAVIFCFFLFVSSKDRTRWLFLLMVPLFLIAFRRADSQGGIMALTAGCAAASVLAGPVRNRARLMTLAYVAAGLYYFTIRYSPRILTEGGHSRKNLWDAAIVVWHQHPLKGVGPGNFQLVEPTAAFSNQSFDRIDLISGQFIAHNTYLNMLADVGAIGLSLMSAVILGALFIALRAAREFDRQGNREMSILSRGVIVGLITLIVDYTFISGQYEKPIWLLTGFCVALHPVAFGYEGRRAAPSDSGPATPSSESR
jgi:O-antigen ligase